MKKLTTNEKILQFLINKNKNLTNNRVSLNADDVETLGLLENEAIRSIHILASDNYLKIIRPYNQNDFSAFWELELTSTGIHYFENKKKVSQEKRNKWIQFWIPVGISIVALLKSYEKEIILLWKVLMQLWK